MPFERLSAGGSGPVAPASPTQRGPTGPAYQYREFLRRSHARMTLAGVEFWIDPQSVQYPLSRVHVQQPTRAGLVRWDYATDFPVIQMRGTPGVAGYLGVLTAKGRIGGVHQMQRGFAPPVASGARIPAETVVWTFPNFFPGVKYVRVDNVTFSMDVATGSHLYHYYDIQVTEVGSPTQTAGAQRVNAGGYGTALPVTPSSS